MEVDQTPVQAKIAVKPRTLGILKTAKSSDLDPGSKRFERIGALETRMKTLEEKSESDNLVFARNREDLDFITNEKKEDRHAPGTRSHLHVPRLQWGGEVCLHIEPNQWNSGEGRWGMINIH